MNKIVSTIKSGILPCLLLCFALIAACGPKEDPVIAVTGVSLDQSSLTLDIGGTANLTATVSPSNATNKAVSWSTSNQSVATVNNGTVTAVAAGTATITATAGGKSATCSVTVNKKEVAVASIDLDQTEAELETGETLTLTATVTPNDATNKTVTWNSSDSKVVTVKDGVVTAVSAGNATITVSAGGKTATCEVKVNPDPELVLIKDVLARFYEAMDGPHWKQNSGWLAAEDLNSWHGVGYKNGKLHLTFSGNGLKGEVPDCIGDLGGRLASFSLSSEPDVTGTLPDSFRKLIGLERLSLVNTGMTSLSDVFSDMTLFRQAIIGNNQNMAGPLPESLGKSPELTTMSLSGNRFEGEVPASWASISDILVLRDNCLTGKISALGLEGERLNTFVKKNLFQKSGYGFDISDIEIHGWNFWPDKPVSDLDGNGFSFEDVISKNKYTVYLLWATWCPFSKMLMPQLKEYYDIYRQDGLEIISTIQADEGGVRWSNVEAQKQEVSEKGYDNWYNFFYWSEELGMNSYLRHTPAAEVYDQNGNILFSSFNSFPDPERGRFGKVWGDLIPFLESLLGPVEVPQEYESVDYSMNGEVTTLQKASVGKGINIVFMGDAYTDKDMGKDGLYEKVMGEAVEEFFSIEPYKTFRNRFNVYSVKAVSKNDRLGEGNETALGTFFGTGSYISGNQDKCFEYALKVPGITDRNNLLVSVLVNTRRYAGTNFMFESTQSSVAFVPTMGNDRSSFGIILRHEACGHGFGFLDDEYFDIEKTPSQSYIDYRKSMYEKYGWFSNIDFTNDPKKVKWSAFLSDDRYKDEVGIFEGATLHTTGAYRPSENSMMRENMEYFNAPSRWAIYKRIMELSGEEASFEKFLEYDAINRGQKQKDSAPRTRSGIIIEHTPPVVLP